MQLCTKLLVNGLIPKVGLRNARGAALRYLLVSVSYRGMTEHDGNSKHLAMEHSVLVRSRTTALAVAITASAVAQGDCACRVVLGFSRRGPVLRQRPTEVVH